jgi:cytochrome P450
MEYDTYLVTIAAAVLLSFIVFHQFFRRKQKLPPINPESLLFTVSKVVDGTLPDFIVLKLKELGKVFRLNMPEMSCFIIIGDGNLARQVFEEEIEKPSIYKRFERVTQFKSTIFTKKTVGENWEVSRKGVASSFSTTNLSKSLPVLHKKVDDFMSILGQNAQKDATFEINKLALSLTMDFISSTMFGVDLKTMTGDENSDGQKMLNEMEIAWKEVALKVSVSTT